MIDLNQFMRRTQADELYVKKDEVDELLGGMQSVTLYASNWVDNTQIVAVEGATADNNILIGASGDPAAFAEAGVYCSAQAEGYLTFKCTTTPTEDIVASVYIGEIVARENVDDNVGGGKLYRHTISIDVGGVDNMGGTDLAAKAMFAVVSSSSTPITNVGSLKKYMTTPVEGLSYLEGTIYIGPLFYMAPCYLQTLIGMDLTIDGVLGVTYLASHDGVTLTNNEEIYGGDMTGKFPKLDTKVLVENDAAAVNAYAVIDTVSEV